MTPEQLRDAITDNSVDSTHNSYGSCRHNVSFAQHCGKCEIEKYAISQRSPAWFERQAKQVPEQLARDVERLRDDATLQEIQCVTARYRESDNPFLQEMANCCDPHAPCPSPDSCKADQICIYRCQWHEDTIGNRSKLAIQAGAGSWLKQDAESRFTPNELRRADHAPSQYQRHTVDITGPAPQYVEDELLAVERRWKRAKVAWLLLGVLVAGFVVWRLVGGGE